MKVIYFIEQTIAIRYIPQEEIDIDRNAHYYNLYMLMDYLKYK